MSTKFDARQSISRDTLDQLATSANKQVDDLLRSINSELTMPVRMKASSPADYVLSISNVNVSNPNTSRKRTLAHIGQFVTSFISGIVTFPSVSGGNITFSTGGSTPVPLVCTVGNVVKVLIFLDGQGNLGAIVGAQAGSEAAAVVPSPRGGTLSIGYLVMFNSAGTISTVNNTNIYQFVGASSGGGLPISAVTASAIDGQTLSSGIHYIIDMSAATGNVTVTAPVGTIGSNLKIFPVGNLSNGYNVIINGNGSDKFYANGVNTNSSYTIYDLESSIELAWDDKTLGSWVVETSGSGGAGAGASLLDPNFDETFIYYTRSDFSVDKKKFFGSTTGTDNILGLSKVTLDASEQLVSSNVLGPVFLDDAPVVNTAQVRLLYVSGKVDNQITFNLVAPADLVNYESFLSTAVPTWALQSTGATKAGQKFDSTGGSFNTANIALRRVGTVSGNLKASIYTDNAGSPGTLVTSSNDVLASSISTVKAMVSFTFPSMVTLGVASFWIVVEASTGFAATGGNEIDVVMLDPGGSSIPYFAKFYAGSWQTSGTPDMVFSLTTPVSMKTGDVYAIGGNVYTLTSDKTGSTVTAVGAYNPPVTGTLLKVSGDPTSNDSVSYTSTSYCTIQVSADGGSTWSNAYQTLWSGLFVNADFALTTGTTTTDFRIKITSATAASELAGFGVNVVQDSTGSFAGDATSELRVISSTEASTGTITLVQVRFTPGASQLHASFNGHDFVAPTSFLELGGGVVQFAPNFFTAGDVVKFYVGYGLVQTGNAPTTINNMLSSNSTMGSIQVPSGYTLDKPWMDIPSGATVSGSGNVETTGVITGDGILATTGNVLSTGYEPTQPKADRIEEATSGKGVSIQGRTSGGASAGCIGESTMATCTAPTGATTVNTDTDVAGMSITLSPGIWLLYYTVSVELYNNTGSTNNLRGRVRVTDGSNNAVTGTEAAFQFDNAPNLADITVPASRIVTVIPTVTTTYKLRIANAIAIAGANVYIQGSSLWGGLTDPDNQSVIGAIRIA